MAIKVRAEQKFVVEFELTDGEAKVLHDIAGYGWPEFIKVFKEKLGKSYIEKHEQHGPDLFDKLRTELPSAFKQIDDARAIFKSINK